MKKFFLVLSVISIALVIAIGCETSQEPNSPQPTSQKEVNKPSSNDLLKRLNAYNQTIADRNTNGRRQYDLDAAVHPNMVLDATRGNTNWKAVFYQDAVAAAKGFLEGGIGQALFDGVTASALEYITQKGLEADDQEDQTTIAELVATERIYNPDEMYAVYHKLTSEDILNARNDANVNIVLDDSLQMVGIIHNAMMDILTSPANSNDPCGEGVVPGVGDLNPQPVNLVILNEEQFKIHYANLVDQMLDPERENGVAIELCPNVASHALYLFFETFFLTSDDPYDIDTAINYYFEQIQPDTELTDQEKMTIYYAMSVAAYSSKYWKNYDLEQLLRPTPGFGHL